MMWYGKGVVGVYVLTIVCVCLGVIQDAKFKRREALADLSKAAQGKGQGKNE